MRFLDAEECRLWIARTGLVIDELGRPAPPYEPPSQVFALTDAARSHSNVMQIAMDWLPAGRERLIYIADADTYPPDKRIIFETIRRGCGATSDVNSTPGHLFVSTKAAATDYEDRPQIDVEEESLAMWIAGLALEWTWPGFIMVADCVEFIELGDGYLRFISPDVDRLANAVAMAKGLELRVLDRFPWQ